MDISINNTLLTVLGKFFIITFHDRMGGKKKSQQKKIEDSSQDSASEESEEDYIVERVLDKSVRNGKVLFIFFHVCLLVFITKNKMYFESCMN